MRDTGANHQLAPRRWWHHGVLIAIVAVSALLLRIGWDEQSPTVDEFAHLNRGLALHTTGDSRLSYAHPPLANELAVAMTGAADGFDPERLTSTSHFAKSVSVGRTKSVLLRRDYPDMRARLMRARVAMGVFLLLLVVYAYTFCLRRWGTATAACTAALLAFNPTLLAHARLVTTDIAVACFAVIATGEVVNLVLTARKRHLVGACLGVAGVVLSKHSGLMFAVVLAAIAAVGLAVRGRRRPWWRRMVPALGAVALLASTSILAVNAAYRFQDTGGTAAEILADPLYARIAKAARKWRRAAARRHEEKPASLILERLPASMPLPFPRPYLVGVELVMAHAGHHNGKQWFWGEPNPDGTWEYFPVLLAIKTPLGALAAMLGAFFAGAMSLARRRGQMVYTARHLPLLVFGGVGALFMALAMGSALNIGFRHALPVVTLWTIPAGWWLGRLWRSRRRGATIAAALVTLSLLAECLWTAPFYLSYFNAAVGRHRGHQISLVSEDWGQNRIHLVRYVEEHGLGTIHYGSEMGTLKHELRYLGLDYNHFGCSTKIRSGWVGIAAVTLERHRERCFPWATGREPDAVIVEQFHLYHLP